jgi:hypothetical protein
VVVVEALGDGVELAGDGLAAQAAGAGGVPAAEHGDGLLQFGDLVRAGGGRAAGQQGEGGCPLADRVQQCRPGDDREPGQGLAPAGDVVRREAFHDPYRVVG